MTSINGNEKLSSDLEVMTQQTTTNIVTSEDIGVLVGEIRPKTMFILESENWSFRRDPAGWTE